MKCLLILLSLVAVTCLYAQKAESIKPKIIIVPRIAEGQNMKRIYDSDMNMQIAMAKVGEAFQKRGANLRSFDQVYRQMKENYELNKSEGNSEDYKSQVLQMSGADIYVETKLNLVKHSERGAHSVTVILDAYQTGTSNNLASKTFAGPMFQTDDVGKLVMVAIESEVESFLNLLQSRFDEIMKTGQSINVDFTLADGGQFETFDDEVSGTGLLLSEMIDEWFSQVCVNGVFNNQGVAGNRLIISDARIPLRKPGNQNANYTGQNFYTDIVKFFKGKGISIKRIIGTNNKIVITIL